MKYRVWSENIEGMEDNYNLYQLEKKFKELMMVQGVLISYVEGYECYFDAYNGAMPSITMTFISKKDIEDEIRVAFSETFGLDIYEIEKISY